MPSISNLKKPACASKGDVLELATLKYATFEGFCHVFKQIVYARVEATLSGDIQQLRGQE